MSLRFKDYAHDGYSRSETVGMLTESYRWSTEIAEQYVSEHKPMYEVEGEFEYDPETDKLTVLAATINGVRLVPEA